MVSYLSEIEKRKDDLEMPIFTYDDVDPLYSSLSGTDKETLLSLAGGQARSFIPVLHKAAQEYVKGMDKKKKNAKDIPLDKEELTDEEFQITMSDAHPMLLQSLYIMGFTQGYCMRHRLQSLDASMYSMLGYDEEEEDQQDADETTEAGGKTDAGAE